MVLAGNKAKCLLWSTIPQNNSSSSADICENLFVKFPSFLQHKDTQIITEAELRDHVDLYIL